MSDAPNTDNNKIPALVKDIGVIPEAYRSLYVQVGSDYVFNGVDDASFKQNLSDFRNNNIKLNNENVDLKAKVQSSESALEQSIGSYASLTDKMQSLQDSFASGANGSGVDVEHQIKERSERLAQQLNEKSKGEISALRKNLEEMTAKQASTEGKLHAYRVDKEIFELINSKAVVKQNAHIDLSNRVKSVWSVDPDTGVLVAKDADGNKLADPDSFKDISPEKWVIQTIKESSHLFESSNGGGAIGSDGGGSYGKRSYVDLNDPTAVGKNLDDLASGAVIGTQ